MTLDSVPSGHCVVLASLALPVPRERRLAELGLRRGQTVAVLGRTSGGGRLLGVGDARIAVDRSTLRAMTVTAPTAA